VTPAPWRAPGGHPGPDGRARAGRLQRVESDVAVRRPCL